MFSAATHLRPFAAAAVLAITGAGALAAVPASAAAASASCTVSGGSSNGPHPNEWSVIISGRSSDVSCSLAKAVVRTCGSRKAIPGWKVSGRGGRVLFTNRYDSGTRFRGMLVGGTPRCIN